MIKGIQVHGASKRRKPKRQVGWKAAQEKHDKWLRKMGVHPEQLKGKSKDAGISIPKYAENSSTVKTSDSICGHAPKKETNTYTGTYIVGIGTMHKSNLVPITSKEDAKNIASMRR